MEKIIIVGTDHKLQYGIEPYTEADIEDSRNFVRDLCRSEKVRFLAEEMTKDGLKEHCVDATIFFPLSSELNIDYDYVDIDRELRGRLGISDVEMRMAAILDGQMEPDKELLELFKKHLTDPIRECSWLAHLITKNTWPTLFICGANHVKSVENRAQEIGIQVAVGCDDYEP